MRAVVQRVRSASVAVDVGEVVRIGQGLLVLVGFSTHESEASAIRMARRMITLRVFDDEAGRLNRSLQDLHGQLLLIPQITLTASFGKGTRPSFHTAAAPATARELFEGFVRTVRTIYPDVVQFTRRQGRRPA